MDRTLYILCKNYTRTYDLLYTLLQVEVDKTERLKLFRLAQERLNLLEREMFENFIEKDYTENDK